MPRTKILAVVWLVALGLLLEAVVEAQNLPEPAKDFYGDPLPKGALARLGTVRWRHGDTAGFVAFLPDGKSVLSADTDWIFRVWEFPSGKELRRFGPRVNPSPRNQRIANQGFGPTGLPVALSPDGKRLACQFDFNDVVLYDVASGQEASRLPHGEDVGKLLFTPDGKHLAVQGPEGGIVIWDWAKVTKVHRHKAMVNAPIASEMDMAFSPDGKYLAAALNELTPNAIIKCTIKLLGAPQWNVVRSIALNDNEIVTALEFAPDTKLLACLDDEGGIYLFDVASGKEVQKTPKNHGNAATLVFAKDGKSLFTRGFAAPTMQEWELPALKAIRTLGASNNIFRYTAGVNHTTPALSPDGHTVAFAGLDQTLHFIDLPSGKEVGMVGNLDVPVSALGNRPGGNQWWTFSSNVLQHWDGATGKELELTMQKLSAAAGSVISPDGNYLAGYPNGKQAGPIFDLAKGKKIAAIKAAPALRRSTYGGLTFAPDGSKLALRRETEQKLEVLEMPSAKVLCSLDINGLGPPTGRLRVPSSSAAVIFSGDGQKVAAYRQPAVFSIWDIANGNRRVDLAIAGTLPIVGGAFTPDGRSLVLDMGDSTVILWELSTGEQRRVFGTKTPELKGMPPPDGPDSSNDPRTTVAVAPSGELLVHAGSDNVLRIWNVWSGKKVADLEGHAGVIRTVAFAADGKTLASGSADTTALIWDLSKMTAKPPARGLTVAEVEMRWQALKSENAVKAFDALCDLVGSRQEAVAYFQDQLKPALSLDAKRVDKLIADLDNPSYKLREQATAELRKLDERLVPALDKALAAKLAPEQKKRLEDLRDYLTRPFLTDEQLRVYRAIEALERIGTPEAQVVLRKMAAGAPGALASTSAQAALGRFKR